MYDRRRPNRLLINFLEICDVCEDFNFEKSKCEFSFCGRWRENYKLRRTLLRNSVFWGNYLLKTYRDFHAFVRNLENSENIKNIQSSVFFLIRCKCRFYFCSDVYRNIKMYKNLFINFFLHFVENSIFINKIVTIYMWQFFIREI